MEYACTCNSIYTLSTAAATATSAATFAATAAGFTVVVILAVTQVKFKALQNYRNLKYKLNIPINTGIHVAYRKLIYKHHKFIIHRDIWCSCKQVWKIPPMLL